MLRVSSMPVRKNYYFRLSDTNACLSRDGTYLKAKVAQCRILESILLSQVSDRGLNSSDILAPFSFNEGFPDQISQDLLKYFSSRLDILIGQSVTEVRNGTYLQLLMDDFEHLC